MNSTIIISLATLTALFLVAKVLSMRSKRSRKQAYQEFLQEDRLQSTLEYQHNVTRQRQDSRIWR